MHIYIYKYNCEACKLKVDSIDSFGEMISLIGGEGVGCFTNDLNSFFCNCFFSLKELNENELKKVYNEFVRIS